MTPADEEVLRLVGAHLGSLASRDLKARCRDGLEHSARTWAVRKRELTAVSSSRWAGSISKATHDQWALARRCRLAHIQNLEAGIQRIEHRLSQPVGQKGTKKTPGGYRSKREWHAKSRRLGVVQDRLAAARADREAGRVHVVRGGKHLARARHHLQAAQLTESVWRGRWEAERWFCQADGESGRDAQVRHALTRLLRLARTCGVKAIAVEDLDFAAEKTREKHGGNKRFRRLISGMPTGRLRARLASMADATGIAVIAVDPAYTSRWGAQHWQRPLTSTTRKPTRHDAAAVAIGRRAQGHHPIRRRTAPPPHDRSDRAGHRTVQAGPGVPGREETRPRIPGPRTRSLRAGRGANAGNQNAQHRPGRSTEHGFWQQDSLPLSLWGRLPPVG
ncbi:IS200/IS605 family accessory protein TnpB-related protein [Streptomyces sp. NPDC088254]|uniref:IS200/IS605 family accessory protein TnpB-related protein n=1 Tax=Streptomyces sp. NPDC088254 TaxID=3365847 RepID=UPI003808C71B